MHHIIKNETSGMLDMSPLKDTLGHVITLRPAGKQGDTVEVDAATVQDDIVQRVLKPKWVSVHPAGVHSASTTPVPAPVVTAPEIVAVIDSAPIAEPAAPVADEAPATEVAPEPEPAPEASMPVETVETSETPMTSNTSYPSKKSRK